MLAAMRYPWFKLWVGWGCALVLLWSAAVANAQPVAAADPVLARARQLGQLGVPSMAAPPRPAAKSPGAFRPARGRVLLESFLTSMFDDPAEREVMRATLPQVMAAYETEAKKLGVANDAAAALTFSLVMLHAIATDTEPSDDAFVAMVPRLRAALDTPTVRKATDRQKQEAYELAIYTASMLVALSEASTNADASAKLREAARASLRGLVGAEVDAIHLAGAQPEIVASGGADAASPAPPPPAGPAPAAPSAPLAPGALAPGLGFAAPQGWTQNSGWHIGSIRDGTDVTSALVRFLPAVEAKGSFGDALRAAWQRYIPAELAGRTNDMVFRRYIGNGLSAHFMIAAGPEKGHENDSLFSLYLIDCGAAWQPMVVAQTYQSDGAGLQMSTRFSFPKSAQLAEAAIATVRCGGALGQPLVDAKALVGNYYFGNSASMEWVNIHTGATSTTFVSYGGRLHLKDNGKLDYEYSSASNQGAGTRFGVIRAAGTWKIEGDTLVVTYSKYDQGDDYHKKGERYRIASAMSYADGEKLTVLRSGNDYDAPINAVTVGDPSTYYSTKKR